MREGSYSTMRLGFYEPIKNLFGGDQEKQAVWVKYASGGLAGLIGIGPTNPCDFLKVRLQANIVKDSPNSLGYHVKNIYS